MFPGRERIVNRDPFVGDLVSMGYLTRLTAEAIRRGNLTLDDVDRYFQRHWRFEPGVLQEIEGRERGHSRERSFDREH